jgi:hypothetical protein
MTNAGPCDPNPPSPDRIGSARADVRAQDKGEDRLFAEWGCMRSRRTRRAQNSLGVFSQMRAATLLGTRRRVAAKTPRRSEFRVRESIPCPFNACIRGGASRYLLEQDQGGSRRFDFSRYYSRRRRIVSSRADVRSSAFDGVFVLPSPNRTGLDEFFIRASTVRMSTTEHRSRPRRW